MKCKTYYAADLSMCPVCKTEERVSPLVDRPPVSIPIVPETALPVPDEAALEEERERFLREFKSQSLPRGDSTLVTCAEKSLSCSIEVNHRDVYEPAGYARMLMPVAAAD